MIIAPPAGCRADFPPVAPQPFWVLGTNIRFRMGIPETIGLFARLEDSSGDPVVLPPPASGSLDASGVSVYADRNSFLIGSGEQLYALDWDNGHLTPLDPPAPPASGRWWFAASDEFVIAARSHHLGSVYVVDRASGAVSVLSGAPSGAICGGIVGGILVLGGVESVGSNPSNLLVRWSARRTDPSSSGGAGGPFGFEDWTPSDLNSAGEILLDHGSVIVGGGATGFGFIVFTDMGASLLEPRADLYVFSERQISERGLLAPGAWAEVDGRVWWYDSARVLNFFDGGAPRQVPNPMRMASVEAMDPDRLGDAYMSVLSEFTEVVLHYVALNGQWRELVYNYLEDAWYPWGLTRIAMIDRSGRRPAFGIDPDGGMYLHDLFEVLPETHFPPELQNVTPLPTPPASPFHGPPESFPYALATNLITQPETTRQSIRASTVHVNHIWAREPGSSAPPDPFSVTFESYGEAGVDAPLILSERVDFDAGQGDDHFRLGGKALRMIIHGTSYGTFHRFGQATISDVPGGRR